MIIYERKLEIFKIGVGACRGNFYNHYYLHYYNCLFVVGLNNRLLQLT